jgi:hypothetical protein
MHLFACFGKDDLMGIFMHYLLSRRTSFYLIIQVHAGIAKMTQREMFKCGEASEFYQQPDSY